MILFSHFDTLKNNFFLKLVLCSYSGSLRSGESIWRVQQREAVHDGQLSHRSRRMRDRRARAHGQRTCVRPKYTSRVLRRDHGGLLRHQRLLPVQRLSAARARSHRLRAGAHHIRTDNSGGGWQKHLSSVSQKLRERLKCGGRVANARVDSLHEQRRVVLGQCLPGFVHRLTGARLLPTRPGKAVQSGACRLLPGVRDEANRRQCASVGLCGATSECRSALRLQQQQQKQRSNWKKH